LGSPSGHVLSNLGEGNGFAPDPDISRQVLTFPMGNGLSLQTAGLAPPDSYSVVMLFRLDGAGRRKLLDFAGGTSDAGLYLCDNGGLLLEEGTGTPCTGGSEPPGGFVQLVLTRAPDDARVYLNGTQAMQVQSASGVALLGSELRFFKDDDVAPANEHAAGAVARIRVYDNVLTAEEVAALDRVDGVAPDTAIASGPAGPTNDATPDFAFSSTELAGFACRHYRLGDAPPGFTPCPSPHTLGPLGDDTYLFEVAAIDAAGNSDASPAGRSFRVDTTPPRTTITGGPGDTTAANAAFFFSAPGATAFSCRLDGGAWRACDSPQEYAGLSLGSHRFEVRSVDEAGNEDPTPAEHAWQVLKPGLVIPATLRQATALAAELVQMRRALSKVRLRTLRRRRTITLRSFDALTGGTVEVRARARVRGRWVTVLSGKRKVRRAGRYPVRVTVTTRGRRLARGRETLPVELRLTFTDLARRSLWATTRLTLRR
jgi:Concanavalin A-like lectin/glucanases superfamily